MLTVQVQMSPGCGHGQKTVELVRDVLSELRGDARVETVTVATMDDAERLGFRGSPTVLVDGADIEPGPPGGVGRGDACMVSRACPRERSSKPQSAPR